MMFSGPASAMGGFGVLGTSANATVSNAFFNINNPPYYDGATDQVNGEGVPDYFAMNGEAGFTDPCSTAGPPSITPRGISST